MTGDQPQNDDGSGGNQDFQRRNVLKSIGGLAILGTAGTGTVFATGPPDDRGGGPPDDDRGPPDNDEPEERTIEWAGQGSEHATQDCPGGVGVWHWVLTPGGSTPYESVGELTVEFADSPDQTVQGIQRGQGAYHFHVRSSGGGTVEAASVEVTGGGRNALLTISDGGCEDVGVLYWQVDFGEGDVKEPPEYYPDDLMAALGNSDDGVTDNPSLLRQATEGQLEDVDIDGNQFTFDDDDAPTEVTVEFAIDSDGESRDLHLSSWILPGEFDEDDIDQQERYDAKVEAFDGGESGELTIGIPQLD